MCVCLCFFHAETSSNEYLQQQNPTNYFYSKCCLIGWALFSMIQNDNSFHGRQACVHLLLSVRVICANSYEELTVAKNNTRTEKKQRRQNNDDLCVSEHKYGRKLRMRTFPNTSLHNTPFLFKKYIRFIAVLGIVSRCNFLPIYTCISIRWLFVRSSIYLSLSRSFVQFA